jgi:tape measure domain-containing protein
MSLNTNITVGADSSGVATGLEPGKRALKDFGATAKGAGDALGGIGAGGAQSAQKVESATKSMIGSLQRQIAATEAGDKSTRAYQESLARLRGVDTAVLRPYLDQLDAAKEKAKQAAVANKNLSTEMGGLGASFRSLAATAAAGLSVRAFVQAADAVTILNNQLKLATGSTQAASKAYTALFDIAQRSRVSFTELGGTFASISRAGEALGISQTRLLSVTESISNAVAISGGSAESARASLIQLSQGLASGTLRGDELNSVMEQTPRLAKALADGLGVSTGELRKLGEQGKITASAVIGALESQSKVLSGEVKNSVVTVGQAFTQLQNSAVLAVGEFDKASGASNSLAKALQGVAGVVQTVGAALKENQTAIQTTAGALAGLASVAVVSKLAAVATGIGGVSGALVVLRGVVASLNPWTLALLVGGVTVGAVSAYADAQSKTIKGMASDLRDLERLNARAAADPSDAILNAKVGERTQKIIALRTEIERLGKAQEKANGPDGSVGSGDTALRRELARQSALAVPDKAALAASAAAQKAALAEMSKAQDTYNALVAKGTGYTSDYNDKLADLALLQKAGKISTDQLKDAQSELEKTQPYAIEQAKMWAEQTKASAKAIADSINAYEQYTKALDDSADSVAAQVQKLQDEEAAATIAAAQNISLAQAIEQVTIARLAEAQAKEYAGGNQEAGDAIKREIEQRKLLATALGSKDVREASVKTAKEAADDWKKAAEKINDSITDALLRGFESGKGFAENLRDTVANMFKTMVLRPVIQATVGAGLGAVGLNAAASSVTSGIGLADGFSAATASSAFGLGLQGTIATISEQGFIAGFGNAMTSASALASSGSFVSAAGAAIPYVGAAIAAVAVLDKLFSKGTYVKSTGDAAVNFGSTGNVTSASDFAGQSYAANVSTAANDFVVGLNDEYIKAAKSLNLGAVASAFAFGSNDSGKFRIGGTAGGVSFNSGELDQSPEAVKLAASRAVFAALQGSELPKYLAGVFDGVTASTATQEQISASISAAQALKGFYDQVQASPFASIKDLTFEATQGLIGFAGGLDKLTANLSTYYDNFYTAEEKRGQTLQNIATTLNAARDASAGPLLPLTAEQVGNATREQFRATIEGIDTTTEAGQKLYTAMLAVSGAFAGVTDSAADIAKAAKESADAAAKAAKESADAYDSALDGLIASAYDIGTELAAALGNAEGVASRTRSGAISSLTKGVTDPNQIASLTAQYDYTEGLRSILAVTKETTSLQERLSLLDKSMSQEALAAKKLEIERNKELSASSNAATKDLLKQIYTLEDASVALSKAADALRDTLKAALDASRTGVGDAVAAVRANVETQKSSATTAYTAQADAIRASLDTVGGSISKLQSLSGNLKSTLDGMRLIGAESENRVAAQAQISAALATARAGGGLPVNGQLDNALRTASQSSDTQFASFADYAFDFYRTANDIAALGDLTATQLTGEELTQSLLKTQADTLKTGFDAEITRLDALVTTAQAQADATTKATSAILSLADAITAFTASLGVTLSNSLATAFDAVDLNGSGGVGFDEFAAAFGNLASEATLKAIFDKTDANGNGQISQLEAINANTANLLARMTISGTGGNQAGAGSYTGTQVADAIKATTAAGQTPAQIIANASTGYGVTSISVAAVAAVTGNTAIVDYQAQANAVTALDATTRASIVAQAQDIASAQGISAERALYDYARSQGINAVTLDKLMGFPNGTSNAWAQLNSLPAFAQGINYVPEDMTARIHKGERILPAADNSALIQRLSSPQANNDALIAEIRLLRAEIELIKAPLQNIDTSTSEHRDMFGGVTENGNAMRSIVMEPIPV